MDARGRTGARTCLKVVNIFPRKKACNLFSCGAKQMASLKWCHKSEPPCQNAPPSRCFSVTRCFSAHLLSVTPQSTQTSSGLSLLHEISGCKIHYSPKAIKRDIESFNLANKMESLYIFTVRKDAWRNTRDGVCVCLHDIFLYSILCNCLICMFEHTWTL